jgi:hypothetical protein
MAAINREGQTMRWSLTPRASDQNHGADIFCQAMAAQFVKFEASRRGILLAADPPQLRQRGAKPRIDAEWLAPSDAICGIPLCSPH